MDVDLESHKRKAEESHIQDLTIGEVVPQRLAVPNPQMSLDELVRLSIFENTRRFDTLQADNTRRFRALQAESGKRQKEGTETRKMAAKAVVTAEETKNRMDTTERRSIALDKGNSIGRIQVADTPQSDRSQVGRPEGDTAVLVGFRGHPTREECETELNEIMELLPAELQQQMAKKIIPALRGKTILIKTHPSPEGINETRRTLIEWCKQLKVCKIQRTTEGEGAREFYAMASQPYETRQQSLPSRACSKKKRKNTLR